MDIPRQCCAPLSSTSLAPIGAEHIRGQADNWFFDDIKYHNFLQQSPNATLFSNFRSTSARSYLLHLFTLQFSPPLSTFFPFSAQSLFFSLRKLKLSIQSFRQSSKRSLFVRPLKGRPIDWLTLTAGPWITSSSPPFALPRRQTFPPRNFPPHFFTTQQSMIHPTPPLLNLILNLVVSLSSFGPPSPFFTFFSFCHHPLPPSPHLNSPSHSHIIPPSLSRLVSHS